MTSSVYKIRRHDGLLFAVYFLLAALFSCWVSDSHLYAQDAEIYIDNTASYRSKSRPAVYFSHDSHMESYDCLDCHHVYQNGENVLNEDDLDDDGSASCGACHSKEASIELKTAYHRQCMGCHRRVGKQEADTLPVTCQDCHSWRSPAP